MEISNEIKQCAEEANLIHFILAQKLHSDDEALLRLEALLEDLTAIHDELTVDNILTV
jgi:hypothetical protein